MSQSDSLVEQAYHWPGTAVLRPVWEELARRMGQSDRPVARFQVQGLNEQARVKIAELFGLPRRPDKPTLTLDAEKFRAALGLESAEQLRMLVERICGPIGNRAAERAAAQAARADLWHRASERLEPRTPGTFARIRAAGVPEGDVEAHAARLTMLADALDVLPSNPPMPLPMLAWQVSGDPHALDADTWCGKQFRLGAAELAGRWAPEEEPDGLAMRQALLDVGVILDRLSFPTLTFGLRAKPDSSPGRLLELAAASHMPLGISGAMLDAGGLVFTQRRWLCVENPSVVEAALCTRCDGLPIVCTSGWPSTDAQRLLALARDQGVELLYAGDYDRAGLEIARFMAERHRATILMTREEYLEAIRRRLSPPWHSGTVIPDTPWDPGLAQALRDERRPAYQEDPAIWRRLLASS